MGPELSQILRNFALPPWTEAGDPFAIISLRYLVNVAALGQLPIAYNKGMQTLAVLQYWVTHIEIAIKIFK